MNDQALKFQNHVELVVRSGDTGKVLHEYSEHNDISDDFLASTRYTLFMDMLNQDGPWCFILRDGPAWSGFTWDRRNPWAPYCTSNNASADAGADPHWKTKNYSWDGSRHKLFFQWTKLANDISVKALGLCGLDRWVPNYPASCGITTGPGIFVPQTLVVLPSPILIHGRNGGATTPDILEISYFLSIVGVN